MENHKAVEVMYYLKYLYDRYIKYQFRGAAITEYAVILAFVAVVALAVFGFYTEGNFAWDFIMYWHAVAQKIHLFASHIVGQGSDLPPKH